MRGASGFLRQSLTLLAGAGPPVLAGIRSCSDCVAAVGRNRKSKPSAEATTTGRDLKSIGFDMQATFLRKLGSKCWPTDPVLAANVG